MPGVEGAPEEVHGVQGERLVNLDVPLGLAAVGNEKVGIHKMGESAAGIEFDGAAKMAFGRGSIVIEVYGDIGETDFGFGE